ncbi:YdcF family protein [Legionella dresdenensis]|uniref:YdcF family protein n=1 Tax=Legionella dresdenensis TaxID=450200 RepID=A0ABV8CGT4_9GAMM
MFVLRHLLEALLNPFLLALILFAILLMVLYRQPVSRFVFRAFMFVFLIFLLISTSWLPRTLTSWLEGQYPSVVTPEPAVKWVVVLSGGQSNQENKPANMLLYSASLKRLIEGVRLFRQLPEARLLLSGGGYGQEIPEAEHLATVAKILAVPVNRLVLESQSINTAAEALELKKLLGNRPFYLVTSAVHMPRSMLLCRAEGLNPIAAPTDFTLYWEDERWEKRYLPDSRNLVYLTIALHEMLGLVWYHLTSH